MTPNSIVPAGDHYIDPRPVTRNKMSLAAVLTGKTVRTRHDLLSKYLRANRVGKLPPTEAALFARVLAAYCPDTMAGGELVSVGIMHDSYGNKHFRLEVSPPVTGGDSCGGAVGASGPTGATISLDARRLAGYAP